MVAVRDPNTVHLMALTNAGLALDTDMATVPSWPWRSLDGMCGLLVPGTVTYICAFPGNGKSSFIAHLVMHWLTGGFRVFHMPLEATPHEWLVRLLCLEMGINPDEVLSLGLLRRAQAGEPFAINARERLRERYDAVLAEPGPYQGLVTEPASSLSARQFREACHAAATMDCDILCVDHVDHIGQTSDDSRSEMAISREVQHDALRFAQQGQKVVVLASQLNSSRAGGDPMAHFRPPRTDWLWQKGVKEQVATSILGLFRPLRSDLDDSAIRDVTRGIRTPAELAEPNAMGVVAMKLRYGGASKDRQIRLRYERGVISDMQGSPRTGLSDGPY